MSKKPPAAELAASIAGPSVGSPPPPSNAIEPGYDWPSVSALVVHAESLQQLLAIRHRALIQSRQTQVARRRHHRFLRQSAGYLRAFRAGEMRRAKYPGDHREIAGLKWWVPVDIRKPGGLSDRIVNHGWLPFKDIARSRRLTGGTAMVDIGANIGTTSIPRVVLGDFEYVFAAEPEPANYAALVENIVANGLEGFILPDNVAISDADGEVLMRLDGSIGNHRLLASTNEGAARHSKRVTVVQSRTLDSWLASLDVDIYAVSFIKTDCQGWEGHIFRGAQEVLRHSHIIWQIEFWPKGIAAAGMELQEVYDTIKQNFSHFVDLRHAEAMVPTSKIDSALSYFDVMPVKYTDLMLLRLDSD